MVIQHNIPAINAHRNLGINNSKTAKNLEKLSSGYKINRAGDDAAGLAISEKMRGQIRGLAMAEQNANNGISLIQTAEGGLNETHDILQRMRELAVQSSNGTYQDSDRAQIEKEYQSLKSEIDRIASYTNYNGIKLLDGTTGGVMLSHATGVTDAFADDAAIADMMTALGFGDAVTATTGEHGVVIAGPQPPADFTADSGLAGMTLDTVQLGKDVNLGAGITKADIKLEFDKDTSSWAVSIGDYVGTLSAAGTATLAQAGDPNTDNTIELTFNQGPGTPATDLETGVYTIAGVDITQAAPVDKTVADMGIAADKTVEFTADGGVLTATDTKVTLERVNESGSDKWKVTVANGAKTFTGTYNAGELNGTSQALTAGVETLNIKFATGTFDDNAAKLAVGDKWEFTVGNSAIAPGAAGVDGVAIAAMDDIADPTDVNSYVDDKTKSVTLTVDKDNTSFDASNAATITLTAGSDGLGTIKWQVKVNDGTTDFQNASKFYTAAELMASPIELVSGANKISIQIESGALLATPPTDGHTVSFTMDTEGPTAAQDGAVPAAALNTLNPAAIAGQYTTTPASSAPDKALEAAGFSGTKTGVDIPLTGDLDLNFKWDAKAGAWGVSSNEVEGFKATAFDATTGNLTVSNGTESFDIALAGLPTAAPELNGPDGEPAEVVSAGFALTVSLAESAAAVDVTTGVDGITAKVVDNTIDTTNPDFIRANSMLEGMGLTSLSEFKLDDGLKDSDYELYKALNNKDAYIITRHSAQERNTYKSPENLETLLQVGDKTFLGKANGENMDFYDKDGKTVVATLSGVGTANESGAIRFKTGDHNLAGIDATLINKEGAQIGAENTSRLVFQIGANGTEDQQVGMYVFNMSTNNLGDHSKGMFVSESTILTRDQANLAVATLDSAINYVSGQRADLGALQNRLEHTLNNLGVTKENLTAAESSIRDVDMAKEMMDFTKNNILVQAAQAMLAQANQLPQGVLQLLR